MRPLRVAAAGLVLLRCLGPAVAPAGELSLPDEGHLMLRVEEDRELCRDLQAGQVLRWHFEANAALVFTGHVHVGIEARSLWRKDEIRHDSGQLKAAVTGHYCLTWFNYQDSTLSLEWSVQRGS